MTSGTTFYSVILPAERTNYVPNPSFEFGATGWTLTSLNTSFPGLGAVARDQRFGAMCAELGYSDNVQGTVWATTGTIVLPAAGSYTTSCYIRATQGSVNVTLWLTDAGTAVYQDIGTNWRRISLTSGLAGSNAWVRIYAERSVSGSFAVLFDGVQLESGTDLTTYIDGDQDGCSWLGPPHESASYRPATTRAGGTAVTMASLGMYIEEHAGVGMAPVVNLSQERAMLDGAQYQRTRSPERSFELTATMIGTTTADLHRTRRRIIDALKINPGPQQQPVRLLYSGAGSEVYIDAYYAAGLDTTDIGVIHDRASIQFVAYDPMWYSSFSAGTQLQTIQAMGSVQGAVWRDPRGQWGTFNGLGGTPFGVNNRIYYVNADKGGTQIFCGEFLTANGTTVRRIAQYANGSFGGLPGTDAYFGFGSGTAYVAKWTGRFDRLVVGGNMWHIGGGPGTSVGVWSGGTLSGGSFVGAWLAPTGIGTAVAPAGGSAVVHDILSLPNGSVFLFGNFRPASGIGVGVMHALAATPAVTAPGIGETLGTRIFYSAAQTGPYSFAVAGSFASINGTAGTHIASLDFTRTPAWGTYRWQPGTTLAGVAVTAADEIYVYSGADAAGSRGYWRVRRGGAQRVTGQSWASVGTAPPIGIGQPMVQLRNGNIFALGGTIEALELNLAQWGAAIVGQPVLVGEWTGYGWIPDGFVVSGTARPFGVAEGPDGTRYLWGDIRGIGSAPSVAPVVNSAMHDVYPVIRITNGRLYGLVNQTTGDGIYGDIIASSREIITIDTRPGRVTVRSSDRGDISGLLLPTSSLATFRLAPGTNYLQSFSAGSVVIYWQPRHWSQDGGA